MQRLPIHCALAVVLAGLAGVALAADYKMKDGSTMSGDHVSSTERGVVLNVGGKPSARVAWTNFTQAALKEFAKNPRARPFVELLIEDATPPPGSAAEVNVPETTAPKREWKKPKAVEGKPVLPEKPGLLAGMFTTGVGWFSLVMMYAAVIYAGYEVAIYRRRPKPLVMGLSAIPVAGIAAPIAFLIMPPVKTEEESKPNAVEQAAKQAQPGHKEEEKKGFTLGKAKPKATAKPVATAKPGAPAAAPAPSPVKAPPPPGAPAAAAPPEPVVYRRGETNINKRFIETKFGGFFKAVPGPAERDMWLVWVTATGGEHWSKRVVSISQTELVVNCPQEGGGSLDQTMQIVEIQEIHLRPQEG